MKNIIILIIFGVFCIQCNTDKYQIFKLTSYDESFDYLVYSKYEFQASDSIIIANIFKCNDLAYKFIQGVPYLQLEYIEETDLVYLTSTFLCITGKKIKDLDVIMPCSYSRVVYNIECISKM